MVQAYGRLALLLPALIAVNDDEVSASLARIYPAQLQPHLPADESLRAVATTILAQREVSLLSQGEGQPLVLTLVLCS